MEDTENMGKMEDTKNTENMGNRENRKIVVIL